MSDFPKYQTEIHDKWCLGSRGPKTWVRTIMISWRVGIVKVPSREMQIMTNRVYYTMNRIGKSPASDITADVFVLRGTPAIRGRFPACKEWSLLIFSLLIQRRIDSEYFRVPITNVRSCTINVWIGLPQDELKRQRTLLKLGPYQVLLLKKCAGLEKKV